MTYVDHVIISTGWSSMLSAPTSASAAVVLVSAANTAAAGGEEVDLLDLAPAQTAPVTKAATVAAGLLRQDHLLILFSLLLLVLLYLGHQVHGRNRRSLTVREHTVRKWMGSYIRLRTNDVGGRVKVRWAYKLTQDTKKTL
jgi:hypothetical protein